MNIFDRISAKNFATELKDKGLIAKKVYSNILNSFNNYKHLSTFYRDLIIENNIAYKDLLEYNPRLYIKLVKDICLDRNEYLIQIRDIDLQMYYSIINNLTTTEIDNLTDKVRRKVVKDIRKVNNSNSEMKSTIKNT